MAFRSSATSYQLKKKKLTASLKDISIPPRPTASSKNYDIG